MKLTNVYLSPEAPRAFSTKDKILRDAATAALRTIRDILGLCQAHRLQQQQQQQ